MHESHTPNLGLEDLRWLHRLARRLVQDPADADDAVQDTVLAALTRAPRSVSAPRGWLATVLHNVVRQGRRGAARRSAREREGGARDQTRGAAEVAEELDWHRTLVDHVNALDEPYRSTIVLRFLRDRSPREIAREQEVPVKTVHTRIERGLAHLRRALDRGHGGDREAWMSAVTAVAAPVGSGVVTDTLVIGGMAMGTMMKVSAAVLVAAACVYFVARTPPAESPRMAAVESPAAEVELPEPIGAAVVSLAEDPVAEAGRRSPVAEEPPARVSAARGTNVLRVVLEGIGQEDAQQTRVTLRGVDHRREWPSHFQDSWPCQGLTSEFDLDPFFASVAGATNWNLHVDELEVHVYHPQHLLETTRIPLSRGVALTKSETVYEARVRLLPGAPHVFWPELTLAVRDAHTRAHLNNVELRCVPTAFMASQLPMGDVYTSLGGGLSSPIALLGGREADGPEDRVVGMALGPAAGEAPQLAELLQPEATDRGVIVYARAPGYAWATIVLDVSTGAERELLLEPDAALDVRLTNVQLERYAALEAEAWLNVGRPRPDGGEDRRVWSQRLDEILETEGVRLEALEPGEYAVSVSLDGKNSLLAREELSLAAGEARELVLALKGPPAPTVRATLGGVVSFPAPTASWGEEKVRLQFYEAATYEYGDADVELSLANLERVGGALPTWSFRVEDLPVGLYQVKLSPFLKSWMIELPAGGAEDVELVIPELAEVLVETVDARTGERIPLEEVRYGYREVLPGQVHHEWSIAERVTAGFEGEPGRFRFWTAPGAAYVQTYGIPSGLDYGERREELELVPGLQSVRFELAPVYAIRFEFRDGGIALPRDDGVWWGLSQGIRGVDHEGRVTSNQLQSDRLVEVSAPGVYEVSFEGIGTGRFHPIPPRRVDVRPGETAEVIVELRRK